MRATNAAGVALVVDFEGLSLTPYVCPAGVWTIGHGATRGLNGQLVTASHRPITREEAAQLLRRDLAWAERWVLSLVRVPLTDDMFAALVSFTFNLGAGNFEGSTLLLKLNRQDYFGAGDEFWKWRRADGLILNGLVRRRAASEALFMSFAGALTRRAT